MERGLHVELGMYPFGSVAWAWDELWVGVHARAPWLPAELTRTGDVHARWDDPDCLVNHVCGAPFALHHLDTMQLIGAFEFDIPEAEPVGHYHSVLLSPHDLPLDTLVADACHVVANSADSLSGWLSLTAATVGPGQPWPGPITFTGAHLYSLRALARGEADLAAIDSLSLALIVSEQPDLVAGLHRVGRGPRIPTPAITARASLDRDRVDEIRAALVATLDDPRTEPARQALHIAGFADNTVDDYRAALRFVPA